MPKKLIRERAMILKENELDLNTYLMLRKKVGWVPLSAGQAEKAIENSLYLLVAYEDGEPVGMGRLVGDGAVICYIQDLIVIPSHQGKGVGGRLIEQLITHVKEIQLPATQMMLDLMCATGRQEFYEKYGFLARPTVRLGPGMIQYLEKEI